MPNSSDTEQNSNRGFIGFRCDPEFKADIEAEARQRGVSVSELARQRLNTEDDD
jgi:predicted HicB family RNase H-like nuclease